jgi:hypothetical protein
MTNCPYCRDVGRFRSAHSGLELTCPHCAGIAQERQAECLLAMLLGILFLLLVFTLWSVS